MGRWSCHTGLDMAGELPSNSSCFRGTVVDIISMYGLNVATDPYKALLASMHCPWGLVRWPVDGCHSC